MRGILWKAVLTALVIVLSLWFIYPTFRLVLMSPEQKENNPQLADELQEKGVKLGLDLQGGTHLVFEVDTTKLPPDMADIPIEEALEVIRSRVDQFGVAEPIIQRVGDMRIVVELPGIQDIESAKQLIKETAILEFRLMRERKDVIRFVEHMDKLLTEHPEILELAEKGLTEMPDSVEKPGTDEHPSPADRTAHTTDTSDIPVKTMADIMTHDSTQTPDDSASITSTPEKPKEPTSAPESVLTGASIFGRDTSDTGEVPMPIATGPAPFSDMVEIESNSIFVRASFVEIVERLIDFPEVKKLLSGSILLWDSHFDNFQSLRVKQLYLLKDKIELTGDHLVDTKWRFGSGGDPRTAGRPVVDLEFDSEGSRIFSKVTGANLKKRLAIVLNERVYTAPTIQNKIRNGKAIIQGIRELDEAKIITIVLKAGSLPVPLNIVEERTVGPTLGEDSIRSGVTAAIIGLLIVMIFMLVYYKFAGVVADIALLLNLLILMAAMAIVHATLTLPGIAGIILTIGMAVDANVLIYERIREEKRAGRTIRMAVEAGYSRAILTIIDANITTLIAAIVLYYFGTGPIRGFAVTLSLGLVISMYTSIIVTRMIFDWYISAFHKEDLSI